MAKKRCLLEMGMGTDLHGKDYTKAAQRAVRDALWHNSVSFPGIFEADFKFAFFFKKKEAGGVLISMANDLSAK